MPYTLSNSSHFTPGFAIVNSGVQIVFNCFSGARLLGAEARFSSALTVPGAQQPNYLILTTHNAK